MKPGDHHRFEYQVRTLDISPLIRDLLQKSVRMVSYFRRYQVNRFHFNLSVTPFTVPTASDVRDRTFDSEVSETPTSPFLNFRKSKEEMFETRLP